jgi:hypothetical protein
MKQKRWLVLGLAGVLFLGFVLSVFAEGKQEEKFPSREVEIMVPWAAEAATGHCVRTFSPVIPKVPGGGNDYYYE